MTSDPTELATQVDVFVLSWGFYTFYAYDFNFNALSTICDWVNKVNMREHKLLRFVGFFLQPPYLFLSVCLSLLSLPHFLLLSLSSTSYNQGGAVIYHGYYFALPGRAWDATWQNYTGPFLQCVPTTGYNASLMNYWGGIVREYFSPCL